MREEEWATMAAFIWLSTYLVYFAVSCVLLSKRSSLPRRLLFIGTLMLLLVNLAFLAEYLDVTQMKYSPMYEDSNWSGYGFDHYPEWQRYYWWGCTAMDFFGKLLAGIGMILEGKRLMTAFRYQEMQKYQPQVTHQSFTPNQP